MTSQILQTELSNLIQESKRKNSDLRNAAEQSLNDLRILPSTSETQLAADLSRKPNFVKPFVLACLSRHAKLAAIGVLGVQRLVASQSLPRERLKDVLDGLHETTSLGLDVQLKTLQTLSSLFQYYGNDLNDFLLASTLEICATLQNSKIVAVSSTAAATLQQLVVSVYEKVSIADEKPFDLEPISMTVGDKALKISSPSYDALRMFDDLCRLVEGEKLEFLSVKSLSRTFVLELIESILVNGGGVFSNHPEHTQILRSRLTPLIVRFLSERHNYSLTVRVARILLLLLKSHMSLLTAECEMALGLLIHLLDDGTVAWKRVICMEIFRSLYSEPGAILLIYNLFDKHEGHKSILRDHMACLVRLASEKPSLIGLSNQSTLPVGPSVSRDTLDDQVALEAVGVAGVIGSPSTSAGPYGISSQWSLVRAQYIDILDKTDAPTPPDTYIYTLVLGCINAFSENIAKFILPLTVAESKSRRKQRVSISHSGEDTAAAKLQRNDSSRKRSSVPLNPLTLESHPQINDIRASASIIETCWPAVLATCSTFLYAALDNDFYHNFVRSFQKLTHVAGLLRLSTPRDAFLTTLGKAALPTEPVNVNTSLASPDTENQPSLAPESPIPKSPSTTDVRGPSMDGSAASINTRNLLCLRALLNLGIALGSTVDQSSWSIILGTLQHAQLIISVSSVTTPKYISLGGKGDNNEEQLMDSSKANLGSEVMAVESAATKLFESTEDYPNAQFKSMLAALLCLSESTGEGMLNAPSDGAPKSPRSPQSPKPLGRIHQSKRSISIALGRSRVLEDELKFVLDRVNELAKANQERLAVAQDDVGIWRTLIDDLVSVTRNGQISHHLRIKASDVLGSVVFNSIKLSDSSPIEDRNKVQSRGLSSLKTQISTLYDAGRHSTASSRATDTEVHELALETLKSVLEQCGETIVASWDLVFDLISSVFDELIPTETEENEKAEQPSVRIANSIAVKSPKLVRTAYSSLQLVASDFLSLLPPACLLELVEAFSKFASQKEDFNISLTTATSFWNLSDYLRGQVEHFSIEDYVEDSATEGSLVQLAKDADPSKSRHSLWLLLLLRIVDLSTDNRAEIRNSAIQTALRIIDAYGEQLRHKAWHLCLNKVLFVMAESVQSKLLRISQTRPSMDSDEAKSWIDTLMVMTKGLSNLIANYFGSIVEYQEFAKSWERLMRYFGTTIKVKLLQLNESTFSSFHEILSRIQRLEDLSLRSLQQAWSIWVEGHPIVRGKERDPETPNQDALLAYVRSFREIYRLLKDKLTDEHIDQVLESLRIAIWESIPSRYSLDVDHQSELQCLVVECLKSLCEDRASSQPAILLCLSEFADSALTKWSPERDGRGPTFVAFSKAVMQLLSWYIADYGIRSDIFSDGMLNATLQHLGYPVSRKYNWIGKDKEPVLWKVSTTASLDVLKIAIPYVEKQYHSKDSSNITQFWECVVSITAGIVSANNYNELPESRIRDDEAFDIEAFNRLRSVMLPSLGSSYVPEKIRRDFACALFNSSLIYPPHRLDLPQNALKKEPLQDLYKIRMGCTYDPPPTLRSRIAYVLIDTLFNLAATTQQCASKSHASSASQQQPDPYVSLAKSVSPYLILRCAIPLKSYIADQPLRGLMPQPTPARNELLYLLQRLVDLKSEPAAIPDAGPTVTLGRASGDYDNSDAPKYRKHLGWVYPFIVKAVKVAGKETEDVRVLGALGKILERVSGEELEGE